MSEISSFIEGMPKAELHVHLEGTLEPELKFQLAPGSTPNLRLKRHCLVSIHGVLVRHADICRWLNF